MQKVSDFFRDEPEQWGLRGDKYLWRELGEKLADVDLPDTVEDLRHLMENSFWIVTGKSLSFSDEFHIARFDQGGMSSGGISSEFWRNIGFPLIFERYKSM